MVSISLLPPSVIRFSIFEGPDGGELPGPVLSFLSPSSLDGLRLRLALGYFSQELTVSESDLA